MFVAVKLLAANLQGIGTVLRLVILVGCGVLSYGAMLLLVGRTAAHCVFELLGEVWRYRHHTASGALSFLSPTNRS